MMWWIAGLILWALAFAFALALVGINDQPGRN